MLLIALAGVGLEALRRKTLREFPGAQPGDWVRSMRERVGHASNEAARRVGLAIRGLTDDDRLDRLGELKEKGVLTATEFREEKKKILSA